ncbi:hypothetical protein Y032_0126g1305 [Ancylostoma ceylanicum]|uniref:Thioredoxin domain-containing protein n=1 Tax=Ancylostoma ceylanicum TaxID=53326 RepID=A0A016T8E9_9BILA|nr:hypothetical protein Y032_0126g1305 [Ancylostoma ceylanicum]
MGHFSDSAPRIDEISENFISKLAKEIVEDAILDAVIEHSDELNECEESEEQLSTSSAEHSKTEVPLDVKILNFFFKIFTFKNMARYLVLLLALMLADTLWDIIVDVYSRPTILKPKGPRPFFPNSSSSYLTDVYTGEFRPERMIQNTDLLVVMYYSPWCFYSQRLRHPFEVVALMLRNHKNIRLFAVNCWTTAGECRKAYKIYQYPVIVAYSSTAHSMYQGEHSTDHLYRWVVSVRNPVQRINSVDQLNSLKQDYHTVVAGFFPFTDMNTPAGYRAFAAAGMMLQTGLPEDESTCLAIVASVQLARELGFRFEGDIVMYIPKVSVFQWSLTISRTAVNIVEWVRGKRAEVAPVRWIHFNRNSELMSPQISQLLNESSALVLITPLSRIYRVQPDVILFTELAREYWDCEQENIQRVNTEPQFIPRPSLLDELANDKQACTEVVEGITKMDSCCRSLLPSVDWNMACASSAKFHWEDEEKVDERDADEKAEKASRRRRSHWTEQVLTATNQCVAVRNGTLEANVVLSRCCANYEEFSQRELTSVHKANAMSKLHARELMLVDSCMRGRLHDYMKYPVLNSTLDIFDEPSPAWNMSLRGMACRSGHENDTLRFAVLDSLHYSYFLSKWGLSKSKLPVVVAIDIRRELFSVMEGKISQKRVREFVRDFHANLQEDHLKSEDDSIPRANVTTSQVVHPRIRHEQVLQRLTLRTFHELIENRHNTTNDVVVFFSGGSWHAPSTAAIHVYHSAANYFSFSNDLIKFYVVDTTLNELPYNFNFDRIPAIVIFLANQTDISWKYPEVLPISRPNVLSFVLSHCSARLRWKMALTNCGRVCVLHNRLRLRKRQEKLLNVIHRIRESAHRPHLETKLQYFVKQLRVVRRVLRALHIALHQSEVLAEESVNSLLHTKVFEDYIRE